jgi:hypothetical protein
MLSMNSRRFLWVPLLIHAALLMAAAAAPPRSTGIPIGFDRQEETEHFVFVWRAAETDELAVTVAKSRGEELFAGIRGILGEAPRHKVVVLFEGDAHHADGSWAVPSVDETDGTMHLYQFGPSVMDYLGALPHELVHVFRVKGGRHLDGFLEEGLAEYIAGRVDPDNRGFPRYGIPLTVAAGQWLGGEEEIPLATLRASHDSLSLRCQAQSYVLRASFFEFLARAYEMEKVLLLANQEHPSDPEPYRQVFHRDFAQLVADWRQDLETRFAAVQNGKELARRYREETAIKFMHTCRRGKDF